MSIKGQTKDLINISVAFLKVYIFFSRWIIKLFSKYINQ